jgi:hypothetical protein
MEFTCAAAVNARQAYVVNGRRYLKASNRQNSAAGASAPEKSAFPRKNARSSTQPLIAAKSAPKNAATQMYGGRRRVPELSKHGSEERRIIVDIATIIDLGHAQSERSGYCGVRRWIGGCKRCRKRKLEIGEIAAARENQEQAAEVGTWAEKAGSGQMGSESADFGFI